MSSKLGGGAFFGKGGPRKFGYPRACGGSRVGGAFFGTRVVGGRAFAAQEGSWNGVPSPVGSEPRLASAPVGSEPASRGPPEDESLQLGAILNHVARDEQSPCCPNKTLTELLQLWVFDNSQ